MKKNKKVYNPVLGKYLSSSENFICALFVKQTPVLIAKWKDSGSPLSFDAWLNYEENEPVKGLKNKFIAKHLRSVVDCLIALWKNSDIERFDTFMEYHHKRACGDSPVDSK